MAGKYLKRRMLDALEQARRAALHARYTAEAVSADSDMATDLMFIEQALQSMIDEICRTASDLRVSPRQANATRAYRSFPTD